MKDHELEQKLYAFFESEADNLKIPAKQESTALFQKPKRKKRVLGRYLTAAACLLLVFCIAAVPLLQEGFIPQADLSDMPDQSFENSESIGISSPESPAPWTDGRLQLTSVTYKGSPLSQTRAYGNRVHSVAKTGDGTENVSISMLADTKISGCVNANLLLITPAEGEHAGCDGVYYDIRNDRVLCLACHIQEQIATDPYYVDVCIRLLIEEHLITQDEIYAGIIDYEPMYKSLNTEEARAFLASGGTPSCESLAFDYGHDTGRYDALMADYQYPVIHVVEYGENENRCLFTIGSPSSDSTWGAYVFELDTGNVVKLDGETVGLPHPINGYMGGTPDEYPAVNLLNATGISVTTDYSKIIVTLPYFTEGYKADENGYLVPCYTGQNVIVFDTENGTYGGLLGNSPNTDVGTLDLPIGHAKHYGELIYYPTDGNKWCLYVGNVCYTLQGELLRLTERDGGYLAVMKRGDSFEVFSLGEKQAEVSENRQIYVLDGNKRILVGDGSSEMLWDNEPAAIVLSADGRYAYLYFEGDGFVTCLDIDSGEQGQLALSDAFVSQISALTNTEFLLFLNPSENRLLIAYFKKGALIFDSQAFLTNELLERDFKSNRITSAFQSNFEKTLSYFYNGDTKVTFQNRSTVIEAAKILGMESLYAFSAKGYKRDMSDLIVEVANRIAETAEYSGNTAEISSTTLNRLLDGMTYDAFEELYHDLYGHFNEIAYSFEKQLSSIDPNNIRILANEIASGVLTYVYGYTTMSESDEENLKKNYPDLYAIYTEMFRRINEGIDAAYMEDRKAAIAEYLLPILTEAGMDDEHPIYTGYQLNSLLETHLDEIVSIALGGKGYVEFIRSCGFAHPYDDAYYSGRTDKRFDCMLISEKCAVDTDALRNWLEDVTFAPGTVEIDREAGIYMEWELNLFYASYYMYPGTEIIAVGHSTDGKAYAVISGSFAEIREDQLAAFEAICGDGEPYNRDAGLSDLFEQIRNEMK